MKYTPREIMIMEYFYYKSAQIENDLIQHQNFQQNRRKDEIDYLESIILMVKSNVFNEIYADVNRILLFSGQK